MGHEIGHAIGLKHPWERNVGVNADGNVIGSVPKPTPTEQQEDYSNLDFDPNNPDDTDDTDDIIINDTAKGWIGLYAFDNSKDANVDDERIVIEEIKKRETIFSKWVEQKEIANDAYSAIIRKYEKAVAEGTATQTKAEAEAAAKTAYDNYTKTPAYQMAFQKRNLYWIEHKEQVDDEVVTTYKLRLHTRNDDGGELPTSAGPFTYTFGKTIMDYSYFMSAVPGKNNVLHGIYPASVYPSFHNWEYDLGVPAPRAGLVWTPRPNPKPVPCGGTPVEQPEQPPTTPSNSGGEDSGSNQNTQPPDTPTDLNASSENGQVHLSWTAPSGTVTDYEYRYRESGGSWSDNWISMISSEPDVLTDTEFFVLSLINGTTYEFQLRAVNGESASTATASSESTPATVPGKPTSLTGDRYNQSVTLRWYPPDNDGGADVTDYQYRYSYTYETYSSWTSIGGTKRSVSIGGLKNGRQYQFQVRAKNSAGYGTESLTIYKTPATTPGAPQNLNAPTGDGEVSLEWDAPSSNGGFKITEYKYSYRESSSDSWDTEGSAGTEQEKTITGLTNSTEYEFRVRAKNSLGFGPWSDTINATPQPPPVWSDIPDPYNLTVGDSFSLDLSSYVTGSPAITWTSGWIPDGLSFSNGVLSGTVTTVESRSIQFTATNSAGSAKSEWVQIVVQAAE